MTEIVETVRLAIAPSLATQGYQLWDVEYEKLGSDMILRVLVDRQQGQINMDELVDLTEVIGDLIDEITPDPFPAAYMLDVSSPGAERDLKQQSDFEWAQNHQIQVILAATNEQPEMELVGELSSVSENGVTLLIPEKTKRVPHQIDWQQIKHAQMALNQDRLLTTNEDFEWAVNKLVQVTTYQKIDGKKEFIGELVAATPSHLMVDVEGNPFEIPRQSIAKARHTTTY
ncbi:ribosome maturation factor RimP [Weissella diestrammenae]|uniref:Ribosome maturation factor RimP n=1 Tax=Weissella diestrammenae TaxID=1162633 RepID=A0A7G9T610_9LACO|nr:ribosome maturation factor RimP [Weissella diestrammenae]MCM0582369.1 ribosome maturation factor RimP [Weissella diestrammenae]QNN75535.1 ribosome maturation factor RimP [Weissella diestrammenae]